MKTSLDIKKNKFDIEKHCILCFKGSSKADKLVSTESGMQKLINAAKTKNDLELLSRIQYVNQFFYHVKNYACYKSYIRETTQEPLVESNENKENVSSNPTRRKYRSLDKSFIAREG